MRNWGAVLAALAGAILLAIYGTTPPGPVAADAPATDFSAVRAMADVREIAKAPHPTGSAENARVRAVLMARMQALGLETRIATGTIDAEGAAKLGGWRGAGAAPPIHNLVGVLPGRDRALPAVLLMAHHDSVWGSPGAADDGAGVASILETVRAIRAGGQPLRDVIVLLTDGEELGLEGAKAFFAGDPLRSRVGVIVNLETRGGGGRASMFETGSDNGAMMALFGAAVKAPVSTSLSVFVYKKLPNSTDYTIAKDLGVPGFNFAFIGRSDLYHSPLATPEALDQGALQDMGRQTLDLTRALADVAVLPGKAPDRTFFDAFGIVLVSYPAGLGWVLLALGGVGYAALAWRGARWRDLAIAGGAMVALVLVAGVLLYAVNLLSGTDGPTNYYDRLAAIPRLQSQALLVCLATLATIWGLLSGRSRSTQSIVAGLAVPVMAIGVLAQWAAPTASYPFAVSLMLGGLAAALGRYAPAAGRVVQAIVAALVVGYMLGFGFFLLQGVGPNMPMVAAVPLAIGALALAPILPPVSRRQGMGAAAILLVLAAGVALWVRLDPIAPSVAVYSDVKT